MAKLNTFVHVVTGDQSAVFGPGDEVPEWAVAAITNPDVWVKEPSAPAAEPEPHGEPAKEPPRGGPGSSADAWREFAESQNLDVPAGASAREIQALWDARD